MGFISIAEDEESVEMEEIERLYSLSLPDEVDEISGSGSRLATSMRAISIPEDEEFEIRYAPFDGVDDASSSFRREN